MRELQAQRQRVAPVDASVFDVVHRSGEWVAAGAPVVALLPPAAMAAFLAIVGGIAMLRYRQTIE